jgi:hypothetical protein
MQLYLRQKGRIIARPATADAIARALATQPAGAPARLALGDGTSVMVARRGAGSGWRVNIVDRDGSPAALGPRWSARRDLDGDTVARLLSAFAAGDPSWRGMAEWKRGLFGQSPMLLIPLTLFALATAAILIMAAAGQLKGWSWRYVPNVVVGVGMIAGFMVYIDLFFRRLRPRLARWIGGRFGLAIAEEDPILGRVKEGGLWTSEDGRPAAELLVTILDVLTILLGLVVPIAFFGTLVVLAARPILA